MAKFSETRLTPTVSACCSNSVTINSMVPLGDCGERRMTSSDSPLLPQGTSESIATTVPSLPTASTRRQSPSARSPSLPRAIEKPRSVSVSRHMSARVMTSAISVSDKSRCRRMRTVRPARLARVTAWRTAFISGPDNRNLSGYRIASSPSCNALSPASRNDWAAVELAPITPGAQP